MDANHQKESGENPQGAAGRMFRSSGDSGRSPSISSKSGGGSGRSSTSKESDPTNYTSIRRESSRISPKTSLPPSLSPSFEELRRKHDTVDYRNYPTYDVQLVDPSEPLPHNYLILRPVAIHTGCGPPVDNIVTDKNKAAQLRSLGDSLLQKKTPLEIVERMCFISFKLSKDGYRKVRRMSIYIRDESVDVDLANELNKLLTVLAFPHLPCVKPHPRFEGINVTMNYGHIRLECPAYLDLIKFIPMLLENLPQMQRITTSEVHRLNFKGIDNRECMILHKPVETDLRELATELQAGNMSSGVLSGEYTLKSYKVGGFRSNVQSIPSPVLPKALTERIKKLSTEASRFERTHKSTLSMTGSPTAGIFKENFLPTKLASKIESHPRSALPKVQELRRTMDHKGESRETEREKEEEQLGEGDVGSDTDSFITAMGVI